MTEVDSMMDDGGGQPGVGGIGWNGAGGRAMVRIEWTWAREEGGICGGQRKGDAMARKES